MVTNIYDLYNMIRALEATKHVNVFVREVTEGIDSAIVLLEDLYGQATQLPGFYEEDIEVTVKPNK